jgi:hypothetical protein
MRRVENVHFPTKSDYQIWHLVVGFMTLPSGHWNAAPNSGRFISGPMARASGGE